VIWVPFGSLPTWVALIWKDGSFRVVSRVRSILLSCSSPSNSRYHSVTSSRPGPFFLRIKFWLSCGSSSLLYHPSGIHRFPCSRLLLTFFRLEGRAGETLYAHLIFVRNSKAFMPPSVRSPVPSLLIFSVPRTSPDFSQFFFPCLVHPLRGRFYFHRDFRQREPEPHSNSEPLLWVPWFLSTVLVSRVLFPGRFHHQVSRSPPPYGFLLLRRSFDTRSVLFLVFT